MEFISVLGEIGILTKVQWILSFMILLGFIFYYHYTSTFNFFKIRGIPYLKPTIVYGNMGPIILGKQSFHDFQKEVYNQFKATGYGGLFEGRRPVLYIFDTEIIKAVTIRDFDHFTDRNTLGSREPRYISRSLLNLKGAEWKAVRSSITPSFSSSRLKTMIPLIEGCAKQMVDFLTQFDKKDVEMKNTMGHFTLEVIGATAFGFRTDALTDENAKFVKVAERFNHMPLIKRLFIFFLILFMPQVIKYLNITSLNLETTEKLKNMLQDTKNRRRTSGDRHNDFLQLLFDAAEKEKEQLENSGVGLHLDDDTIDAQSILFLIAGFETSSTLLSFAIHMLAVRPDIQDQLRAHVNRVTEGNEIDYELLTQLDYLEAFLLETLRMYPPVGRVDRVVTRPYKIPGTSINLDVGQTVAISVYGVHMDPKIYPEPEEFIPERFMKEEKKDRPSHLYLAFGAGPRNCIGLRFAMISAKIAMVALLQNFKFEMCPQTQHPIQFNKRAVLLKAQTGLFVHVNKI